jgi:Rrf2 family protein
METTQRTDESVQRGCRGRHLLTNKGKYGLKAMVYLAGLEPGKLAQVANIAEANAISKKFLDQILTELRRAGLVYSKKGKSGGYALARPANEIRIGAIVRVLDGPLAPLPCASVTAFRACTDCRDLRTCVVRLIMVEARNAIADVLDNRTLDDLPALTEPKHLAPSPPHQRASAKSLRR